MKLFFKKIFKRNNSEEKKLLENSLIQEDLSLYNEHVDSKEDEIKAPPSKSVEEMRELIVNDFQTAEKRIAGINKQYYMLKLFSRAAIRNPQFNEKLLFLDKEVNYLKRLHEELKRKMDIVKYMQDVTIEELEEIYEKLNNFFDHQKIITEEAKEIERVYYRNIKMASAGIIMNKNNIELEKFHKDVNDFIYNYKSLQEAAEYVFFHSGELIMETINSLVRSIQNSNNPEYVKTYNYEYFLSSTLVLTLTLPEWIELFNKIRYVLRIVNDVNIIDYVDFKQNYLKLEIRYFILMLYMESTSKEDSKGISEFNI